ncbi:putative structural protein [Erwinia phage pEa_SNUABM_50]|uniref:Putative structural protein n=3 Tax=Eneladusvirus BF TaxID=2560751 RepID=A0A7L8ZMT9_9CAUD|nr:putative structural protein [Erwinia phage pEa_SNUABM_12]QOI71795.1 putative structural protein [Erwinia phage pEa_SNUABM_47]QOI72334.1 putative structural protein [Erwinia phage pEa_SNUABM_50]QXO11460.1 hypothetical protein pEaSNUABM19_00314 [Erwinia phage pEa_SNUABM_19]QXO12008.1 hypothetical protein pEaSNUABM44_00312 [Erwinia phage pEa_SNUABM_44]
MNNLFNAFSIKVPGQALDDKKFFQYADYVNTSTTVPTDAQTLEKAIAYVRLKQVERKLSELSVPVYFTINFSTAGTASAVPTDAELVVGYISIEPFLSTLETYPDEADRFTAAAEVIKTIIDKALSEEIKDEFFEVQKTYTRHQYPGATTTDTYRELETIFVTVPDSGEVSTVVHIEIKA